MYSHYARAHLWGNHRLNTEMQTDIARLLCNARDTRHRALIVLSGSQSWCRNAARAFTQTCTDSIWIGAGKLPANSIQANKVSGLLGSEYVAVVLDAHDGLHPDALAAVCGTVVAGGALILLTPPWLQWAALADPDYERLASYPHDWRVLPQCFISHLQRSLGLAVQQPGCVHLQESDYPVMPAFSLSWPNSSQSVAFSEPSAEQKQCLAQLVLHSGVSVLLAGRGHGKSALLGFAAQQYLTRGQTVLLVAPSRHSAASVFRHAGSELVFSAPDMLLQDQSITADVLLIDEAAAIPQPMLLELLQRFPRAVFATTTDGYEGTGQGFVLRFLRALNESHPDWQQLNLDAPVRWAANDPLENWLYQALLLDAQQPDVQNDIDVSAVIFEQLNQLLLAENSALLADIYGLLRSAHYRTTPDDLRFLLDAPQLSVYRLAFEKRTIAVALIVEEGSIDEVMAGEIAAGRRRPRGHLLAQTLAVHCDQPQYLQQRVARVVRIAVHTQYQQRGLGSQLLQQIVDDQKKNGVNIIGSSFSATPDVLAFWQRNGFKLLRVGHRRQAASAAPSALVLKVCN